MTLERPSKRAKNTHGKSDDSHMDSSENMDSNAKYAIEMFVAECKSFISCGDMDVLTRCCSMNPCSEDKIKSFEIISRLLYQESTTYTVIKYFRRILMHLVDMWSLGDDHPIEENDLLFKLIAFSKIVPSAEHLLDFYLDFLRNHRIQIEITLKHSLPKDLSYFVLVAIYRMIYLYPNRCSSTLDVDIFTDLSSFGHDVRSKTASLYISAICLNLSDYEISKCIDEKFIDLPSQLKHFPKVFPLMILQQMDEEKVALTSCNIICDMFPWKYDDYLSYENIFKLGEICLRRFSKRTSFSSRYAILPSASKFLEDIGISISINAPVLLCGPPASGKTSLVHYLAENTGNELLTMYFTDSTDVKSIIGTYVCTENPGEFEYREGILARSMRNGAWLIIENLDMASPDVLLIISSFLEQGYIYIGSGSGEKLRPSSSFRLFATTTNGSFLPSSKWVKIFMNSIDDDEIPKLLSMVYETIPIEHLKWISRAYVEINRPVEGKIAEKHDIDLRKLIKWCQRIQSSIKLDSDSALSLEQRFQLLKEAESVFFADDFFRDHYLLRMAKCLQIPSDRILWYRWNRVIPEIEIMELGCRIGRVFLSRKSFPKMRKTEDVSNFAQTQLSLRILENVASCVDDNVNEPVLLIGETGTGKTSTIQFLAKLLGVKLCVINMSQQCDAADLLGGFKPVDIKIHFVAPLKEKFDYAFKNTFSLKENFKFVEACRKALVDEDWKKLSSLWKMGVAMANRKFKGHENEKSPMKSTWAEVEGLVAHLESKIHAEADSRLFFSYVEGELVKAIKFGSWILLDEINLASPETLECISGLIQTRYNSLTLTDRGDEIELVRNSDFRIFACMNPSTDVGKRDLPFLIKTCFTTIHVPGADEICNEMPGSSVLSSSLVDLVTKYLSKDAYTASSIGFDSMKNWVQNLSSFHSRMKSLANDGILNVGSNGLEKPTYSIRTLTRALLYAGEMSVCFGFERSILEGLRLSYLSILSVSSQLQCEAILEECFSKNCTKIDRSHSNVDENRMNLYGYPILKGTELRTDYDTSRYIVTSSVEQNLVNVSRAISSRYPILLQGPTSAGKTSMIEYLAAISGNTFVRVNNHEHTDIQEYIGSYSWDEKSGKLMFKEGILVKAMRNGWWIVLDELNLAPSDVMEALNRLLDDNRELFIPETGDIVRPSARFMLFATQNPAGSVYGGRKFLSRAFRNRFVEIHFANMPQDEICTILEKRCDMAPSYSKKLVNVFVDLQKERSMQNIFDGRESFITLRDLFRWANRKTLAGEQALAENGYILLAERLRTFYEKEVVRKVIEKNLKCSIDRNVLYNKFEFLDTEIIWTNAMKRLYALVSLALDHNEPILLVGETGCGKTTAVQLYSALHKRNLHVLNCHQHTETSDFIGSLKPCSSGNGFFEWVDGALVNAMKDGSIFLLDEISLADDSVLERLNSVLEPSRKLFIAERGGDIKDEVRSKEGFQFCATMNPGGDFGKKELSPALKNRFTEIWIGRAWESKDDLLLIIKSKLQDCILEHDVLEKMAFSMLEILNWVSMKLGFGKLTDEMQGTSKSPISLRDIMCWIDFIRDSELDPQDKFIHGAYMTLIDGQLLNSFLNEDKMAQFQTEFNALLTSLGFSTIDDRITEALIVNITDKFFGIGPFKLEKQGLITPNNFDLTSTTTKSNAMKILRALDLKHMKPILLEGPPGAGKTSLIASLAENIGQKIIRINLSEQTDIMELFGCYQPVEENLSHMFNWIDGPFLSAMKSGAWVLLDELNLANQTVLEGLNACFDHRNSVFIPEISLTVTCHPNFRVFAAQNPVGQGGGRKGLPQSFLNRFIRIHICPYNYNDTLSIVHNNYGDVLCFDDIERIVKFNWVLSKKISRFELGSVGGPWEFNLRDIFRWMDVLKHDRNQKIFSKPSHYVKLLYISRFRTEDDRKICEKLFEDIFSQKLTYEVDYSLHMNIKFMKIGNATLERRLSRDFDSFPNNFAFLKSHVEDMHSLMKCLEMSWMPIIHGENSSGKSSIIRFLANSCNVPLQEIYMHSSYDTSDLLGCYEQIETGEDTREVYAIARKMESFVRKKIVIREIDSDICKSLALLSRFILEKDLSSVLQKIIEIDSMLEESPLNISNLDFIRKIIAENKNVSSNGRFRWKDGVLVKAIKDGSWAVLENANLCPASVLDRLNSLVEKSGNILLHERGLNFDSEEIYLKPHRNFRLILITNPNNGELSRAMRNRGIEIFIYNWLANDSNSIMSILSSNELRYDPECTMNYGAISDIILSSKILKSKLQRSFIVKNAEILNAKSLLCTKPLVLNANVTLKSSLIISSRTIDSISHTISYCKAIILSRFNQEDLDLLYFYGVDDANLLGHEYETILYSFLKSKLIERKRQLESGAAGKKTSLLNSLELYIAASAGRKVSIPYHNVATNHVVKKTYDLLNATENFDVLNLKLPRRDIMKFYWALNMLLDSFDDNHRCSVNYYLVSNCIQLLLTLNPSWKGFEIFEIEDERRKNFEYLWIMLSHSFVAKNTTMAELIDLVYMFPRKLFLKDSAQAYLTLGRALSNVMLLDTLNDMDQVATVKRMAEGFFTISSERIIGRTLHLSIPDIDFLIKLFNAIHDNQNFELLAVELPDHISADVLNYSEIWVLIHFLKFGVKNEYRKSAYARFLSVILELISNIDERDYGVYQSFVMTPLMNLIFSKKNDCIMFAGDSNSIQNYLEFLDQNYNAVGSNVASVEKNVFEYMQQEIFGVCRYQFQLDDQKDALYSLQTFGEGWMRFGSFLMENFVPEKYFDPSARYQSALDVLLKETEEIEKEIDCWSKFLGIFLPEDMIENGAFYCYNNLKTQSLQMKNEKRNLEDMISVRLESISDPTELFIEFGDLRRSLENVNSFVKSNSLPMISLETLIIAKEKLQEWIRRTTNSYRSCMDLLYPILFSVRVFYHGVCSLICQKKMSENTEDSILLKHALSLGKLSVMPCSSKLELNLLLRLHKMAFDGISFKLDKTANNLFELHESFKFLAENLEREEEDTLRKKKLDASIYSYKPEEEIEAIEELKCIETIEQEWTCDDIDNSHNPEEKSIQLKEKVDEIIRLYFSIFNNPLDDDINSLEDQKMSFLGEFLSVKFWKFDYTFAESCIPFAKYLSSQLKENQTLLKKNTEVNHEHLLLNLRSLEKNVDTLLNEYPEHPTLLHIMKILGKIFYLSLKEGSKEFIFGLEALLRKLDEWEAYASSQVTLIQYSKEVENVLLQVRQEEIEAYPKLFSMLEQKESFRACENFHHLYKLTLTAAFECLDFDLTELAKRLNEFIILSTVGSFDMAIGVLRTIGYNLGAAETFDLNLSPQYRAIVSLLENLTSFYSQFQPFLGKLKEEKKEPLMKEVLSQIKLINGRNYKYWDMRIYIDKATKQIGKALKNYGHVLETPLSEAIAQYHQSQNARHLTENIITSRVISPTDMTFTVRFIANDLSDMQVLGKYNVIQLLNKFKILAPKNAEKMQTASGYNYYHELTSSILEIIADFRQEDQRLILTKDTDNRALYKQRQKLKKSTFVDFMKQFKSLGLRYLELNISSLSALSSLRMNHFENNSHLLKLLSRHEVLEKAYPKASNQLTREQSEKSFKMMSNLVDRSLKLCTSLTNCELRHQKFQNRLNAITCCFKNGNGHYISSNSQMFKSVEDIVSSVLKTCSQMSKMEQGIWIGFRNSITAFWNNIHAWSKLGHPNLVSSDDFVIFTSDLRKFIESLNRSCRYVFFEKLCTEWLDRLEAAVSGSTVYQKHPFDESSVNDLVESCLLMQQKIYYFTSKAKDFNENSVEWILETERAVSFLTDMIADETFGVKFEAFLTNILPHDEEFVEIQDDRYFVIAELLNFHLESFKFVLKELRQTFHCLTKMGYLASNILISIFENGFCVPDSEDRDQDDHTDQFEQDGTGMASGTGKKDVTEEIEDEEQIIGLQGEESQQQQPEENNDGKEMENDFDANLEDVKKDEGDDPKESSDYGDDAEDEMGDLGEENTVDENIWGEEHDQDVDQLEELDDLGEENGTAEDTITAAVENESLEDNDIIQENDPELEEHIQEDTEEKSLNDESKEAESDDHMDIAENVTDIEEENLDNIEDHGLESEKEELNNEPAEEEKTNQDDMAKKDDSRHNGDFDEHDDNSGNEKKEMNEKDEDPLNKLAGVARNGKDINKEIDSDAEEGPKQDIKPDEIQRNLSENIENMKRLLNILENSSKDVQEPEGGSSADRQYEHADEHAEINALDDVNAAEEMEAQNDLARNREDLNVEPMDIPDDSMKQEERCLDNSPSIETSNVVDKNRDDSFKDDENYMEDEVQEYKTQKNTDQTDMKPSFFSHFEDVEMTAAETDLDVNTLNFVQDYKRSTTLDASKELWSRYEKETQVASSSLCEKLRLVLEPTQKSKLRGDYKSGKRLNMRRIISYIASDFKKDKIWMRRTLPNKRKYQVMIAIDDSKSMKDSGAVDVTFKSLATVASALTKLEVGQIGIVSFGENVRLVHRFEDVFTSECGSHLMKQFTFTQEKTKIKELMQSSLQIMKQYESHDNSPWRLQIIMSDGLCENHDQVRKLVMEAKEEKILPLFVIIDNQQEKNNLLNTKNVTFVDGKLVVKDYMETFPFDHYIVLRNFEALPEVISNALRQWFSIVNQ